MQPAGRREISSSALPLAFVLVMFVGFLPEHVGAQPMASRAADPLTNVLLITVDTLRPDALGWVAKEWGGGDSSTPVIDRLAGEGFRFPAAVSPAPVTQPAHVSIVTGLIPRRHGVRDNGQVLGNGPVTLGEHLGQRGYRTGAFVSGYPLVAEFGLDRGFDHYDDHLSSGSSGRLERPAGETTQAALAWLASAPEPWFLWVHYYDPHDPYTPPEPFGGSGLRAAYQGEVATVDREIGRLQAGLKAPEAILTVFTADHGESLGEHGEQTHGFFIYDSTMVVPLVFHFPGRVTAAQSAASARLVDIAPTVLELLGLPPMGTELDGVSLVPLLAGKPQQIPAAYLETRRPWLSYGWSPLRAIRQGDWKLIAAPRPELYDLASDPDEAVNLVRKQRRRASELQAAFRRVEARPVARAETLADPEVMARLAALGYTGAGSESNEPTAGLADPKDRVELWNLLSDAVTLVEQGKLIEAVARFDKVLEQEPNNPFALSRSGAALSAAGQLGEAVTRLRRATEVSPADAETRKTLAVALSRSGRDVEATEHWLELVRLRPRRVDAWVNLATSLGRSGKSDEALRALEHAAELAPERVDLRIRLAFVHHASGNLTDAIRHFELAAEHTGPGSFPHSGALGLLLLQRDQAKAASVWLARSRPKEGEYAEARYQLALLQVRSGDSESARKNLQRALETAPEFWHRAEADPELRRVIP